MPEISLVITVAMPAIRKKAIMTMKPLVKMADTVVIPLKSTALNAGGEQERKIVLILHTPKV